jgi:hypothetical protein
MGCGCKKKNRPKPQTNSVNESNNTTQTSNNGK